MTSSALETVFRESLLNFTVIAKHHVNIRDIPKKRPALIVISKSNSELISSEIDQMLYYCSCASSLSADITSPLRGLLRRALLAVVRTVLGRLEMVPHLKLYFTYFLIMCIIFLIAILDFSNIKEYVNNKLE